MTPNKPCPVAPATNVCVTPVAVSYVSSEEASVQAAGGWRLAVVVTESVTATRITSRKPEASMEAYGSVAEKICPLPIVKLVAAPIIEPLEL